MNATFPKNDAEQKWSFLVDLANELGSKYTSPDDAENVVKCISQAINEAAREMYQQWLLQFEPTADVIEVDGEKFRFKMVSKKKS